MSDISKKQWIEDSLRRSYEAIAADFDHSRQYSTPELQAAVDAIKPGHTILDLGCGNGRLLKAVDNVNFDYLGIDTNPALLRQAQLNFPQATFVHHDMVTFEYGVEQWDNIFAIASFHHLVTTSDRLEVLSRVYAGLKPGGSFIMTNWRLWQWRYAASFFYWWRHKMAWNDTFITWNHQHPRYYHAFTTGELHRLLRAAGFTTCTTTVVRNNYVTRANKL